MTGPLVIVAETWGVDAPDWVQALARACAETSQNKVAARLGYSAAVISQVLRRKYPGDMGAVEEQVRGHLLAETVACPARGVMPTHLCRAWRAKARNFQNTNAERVMMHRACHRCARYKTGENHEQG